MYLLVLLLCLSIETESTVMLSRSGDVFVCPGSRLSLRCSTNLDILEWNITVGMLPSRRQLVTDVSRFDLPLMISSHSFNIARDSADRSKPIVSTLTTSAVTSDLNGTTINCTDVGGADSSTLIATINVITPDLMYLDPTEVGDLKVTEFGDNDVTVTFQWTHSDGVSYVLDVAPPANHNITFFEESASVQIQVLYNTVYNVSLKSSLCGQINSSTSFLLNFTKCVHPLHLPSIDINLRVDLDNDSALIGTNASFTCLSGRSLIGSSKATCIGNGIWEPDPRENQCKINCGTPPVPSNGIIIPYTTGTTEGAQAIILCRDIFHSSLLRDNYTVSMCTMTGQWEPDPNDYCAILSEKTSDALSQTFVIAVAVTSSSAVLILIFFGLGIICGCLCRQCKNEKSDSNNNSSVVYEEVEQRQNLELNQNMAYGPVRKTSVVTRDQ